MDNFLWATAVSANVGLLFLLHHHNWIPRFQVFTAAMFWALLQAPLMFGAMAYSRDSDVYYWTFYGHDYIQVLLYALAVIECYEQATILAFTMAIYLGVKFPGLVLQAAGHPIEANLYYGLLRFANFLCLGFWIYLTARYDWAAAPISGGDNLKLSEQYLKTTRGGTPNPDDEGDPDDGGAPPPSGGK